MRKQIDKGAQLLLKLNEKIQAGRNNPFSKHGMAMDALKGLDKKRPAETPVPPIILDSKGRLIG